MIVYSNQIDNLKYYEGKHFIYFEDGFSLKVKPYDEETNYDFVDRFENLEENVLIIFQGSLYHVMIDNIAIIMKHYSKNPNTHFLFNMLHPFSKVYNYSFVSFLFEFLKYYKIKYTFIDPKETNGLLVNNLSFYDNVSIHQNMVDDVYKYTKHFAIQQNISSKKVYLSRKSVIPKNNDAILKNADIKNLSFIDDKRIDSEETLENFFKDNGFLIVYPEDFSSFREQIGFMQEVDVLVSLTGASLTNCIFMKPGKTVIELSTTLVLGGEESLHTHFYDIAYAKNHNFISIRHDRVAQNVIDKLTNSGILG
jgi:hypothetical protein